MPVLAKALKSMKIVKEFNGKKKLKKIQKKN
jgi:hypothetical protein